MAGSQQTSGTLASEMISQAQYDYNETGTGFITSDEWLQWLNDGVVDIALKTLSVQDTESVSLVANTVEYALSSDFIKVVAVQYINASGVRRGLKPGHPERVSNIEDRGEPDEFYEFADYVGIYPPLSSATTETARVYIAERPAAIATTGTIPTPAIYDNLLKTYMLAKAAFKDRRYSAYAGLMNAYNGESAGSRQDLSGEEKKQE